MSVEMQQFRVVGVRNATGEDVSIVIDAATKAAAEVKAEQMDIETTHIVRLKADEPVPPDEHELFSAEACEALVGKRTDKLIEEVVPPEEPKASKPAPAIVPPAPATQAKAQAKTQAKSNEIVAAITRPVYAAPNSKRESSPDAISGARAFSFVLLVLLGITAGAYFVLVHEPNKVTAQEHELIFGEDLFSDVIPAEPATAAGPVRDAFGNQSTTPNNRTPIEKDHQAFIGDPGQAASAAGRNTNKPNQTQPLELQSVVTSHEGRFAVISGKLYKQGAMIGDSKLVSVADDWVLIETAGKQYTLQIEASDTP
ncbi:MAG: hypothetical protein ACE37H_11370 [Phycisphaeraceae bacterium]